MWLPIFKNLAQGITIHPRPDERHIRYQDARDLKAVVYTEFNIEGNQHNL
jgi:pyridoxine 5-phosphate synthase